MSENSNSPTAEATKPSVMIATPAYGGNFSMRYLESLLNLWDYLGQQQIPVATYFIENESLITRARNTCAAAALAKGVDKLLFIDADVGFTKHDFARLYESNKSVIGGLYPHKTFPIRLNFNPLKKDLKEDLNFGDYSKLANDWGEVEVEHMATGFLMIDCAVLRTLQAKVPRYESSHMLGQTRTFWDFFSVGTHEGLYESEDWRFSRLAREAGYSVWANVDTVLSHTGTFTWKAE